MSENENNTPAEETPAEVTTEPTTDTQAAPEPAAEPATESTPDAQAAPETAPEQTAEATPETTEAAEAPALTSTDAPAEPAAETPADTTQTVTEMTPNEPKPDVPELTPTSETPEEAVEEEISYHAVEKEGEITAIWEMQGKKHIRTIDPRSSEGQKIFSLFTSELHETDSPPMASEATS